MTDGSRMKTDVLGVKFDNVAIEQAVALAYDIISGTNEKTYIVTPNPEIVWMARRNDDLKTALSCAGLVLPDGVGIIIGAKILGTPISEGRVPGIDFAEALFTKMSQFGGSIYLFGAKPGVAERAGLLLEQRYLGLTIAGFSDGYYDDEERIINSINTVSPDVLLVCLGSPKQELWMRDNISRLNVRVCIGLGGSLDVFAGNVKRAPVVFRKAGLEWLYRLFREPRRIIRMLKLPLFLLLTIWHRLSGKAEQS